MIAWTPSGEFEQQYGAAFDSGDQELVLAMLRQTEFALPTPAPAHDGIEPHRWPTFDADGRRWIIAFTSTEAMRTASDSAMTHARIATLDELAAGWPDPTWGLVVNPGFEIALSLESGTVARLAAPSLQDYSDADSTFDPVLQRVLTVVELDELLAGSLSTVSGYVHPQWDTAHLASPHALRTALGLDEAAHTRPNGSLFLIRWRPLMLGLYLPAHGGVSAEARDAVAGAIVEEAPFTGLGFGANRDQLIHEHKAMRAPLPTGAELWELTADGDYLRRAILDRAQGRWRLVGTVEEAERSALRSEPPTSAASFGASSAPSASVAERFVARIDGADVAAYPFVSDLGVTVEIDGGAVPLDALEALHYERSVFERRGVPFAVIAERADVLDAEYLGANALEAAALGLHRHSRGVYRGAIARGEARGLRTQIIPIKTPEADSSA